MSDPKQERDALRRALVALVNETDEIYFLQLEIERLKNWAVPSPSVQAQIQALQTLIDIRPE